MKSSIWKSTLREIKQSFGRFLAILGIVALGVGFFAGLKVTKPAMVKTAEQYFKETDFYNYRLLSTVGFSKADAEKLQGQDGVRAAEGAVSFDILYKNGSGGEGVLKAHSITENVNRLVLKAGRLPQDDTECVVDSNLFDASKLGKKLTLAEDNAEGDLENFSHQEYTIVGIVQSPLYIQFERGTTSLGSGKISGFFYLLPEGFTADYDTEIYICLEEEFPLYSDAYDTYIEAGTDIWEKRAQELADARYEVVVADAKQQLADGKEELEEQKTKAGIELADAKEELADAAELLSDGEAQIAEAKEKLENAPVEIEEKESELTKAEQEIAEQEALLDQAEIALGIGFAQGIDQLSGSSTDSDMLSQIGNPGSAGSSLAAANEQMAAARAQIAAGRTQIAAAKQQTASGRTAIAAAKRELEEGRSALAEKEQEFLEGKEDYESGLKEYQDALEEYNTAVAEAEEKIADGEEALLDLTEPDIYVLGRDANVGYVCFENDSAIVNGIANIFPVFFFLVAALVCITTMNRMVEEQRTQIGVLKALGYSEGTIMFKYLFYSGTAAMLGGLLGFFGGCILFPRVIWYAYGIMYQVDALAFVFDWKLALISLFVSLACSAGTTFLTCRYELSEAAAELMRPKAPKAGKRVLLEYIPMVWNRMKFLQKVSMRNIFRYKKRFFMMIIGISGCTALIVTGFGVRDSIANVAAQQFTEIQTYDIGVTCTNEFNTEMEQELDAMIYEDGKISSYTAVMEKAVDLEVNGQVKSIELVVAQSGEAMEPFLDLHTTGKAAIDYPGIGEAVLTHKIAENYGIKTGDTIILRDEDMKSMEVTVSGINENFVYNYVYMTADTYEMRMGREPEYKMLYVNAADGQDLHLTGTALMTMKNAAAVTVNQDTLERLGSMLKSMNLIVLVIILCAAGLAFIVLYNLTNINITERIREVATIKVLGFFENETCSYVFRENSILAFLGSLVGLVLGKLLHAFVMSQINIDLVAFDVHILPLSYVYSIVLTLVFAWFVNQVMRKKIAHISMTESLKSVD